jgi:autotransporter-associated beta strand protein
LGAGTIFLGDTTGTATAALLGATDARTWANNIIVQANPGANINIIGNNAAVTPVFSGLITLNDDVKVSATGASGGVTLNGAVNAAALTGAGNVTFSGGSGTTFGLGGNNTNFTGGVLLSSGGTLKNRSFQAMNAATTLSINASSTYEMNGYSQTIGGLNDKTNFAGGNVTSSFVSVPLTLAGNGTYAFSGNISGNMSLVKTGSGTQILSGSNRYNGNTTINAGTLLITGNSSSATGAVNVAVGATLGGNGTIGGAVTVAGSLNPGTASTLTLGSTLTFGSGSTLALTLGSNSSKIAFLSTGNLLGSGNATLSLTQDTGFDYGATYRIFENTSTTGFAFSSIIGYDTSAYEAQFGFSSNNYDLTFTAVPEPSSYALLFGLAGVIFARRRLQSRRAVASITHPHGAAFSRASLHS